MGINTQEEEHMWAHVTRALISPLHLYSCGGEILLLNVWSGTDSLRLTLVSVFYWLCIKVMIYMTKPKPKRHNLLALKWWCEQSQAGAGGGWRLGGGRDSETVVVGDDAIHQRTQAVGAWMGFCHEWITTRNVGWGKDESLTRLSLFISCDPQSGLWNKQIPQWERRRGKGLFFNLGGG